MFESCRASSQVSFAVIFFLFVDFCFNNQRFQPFAFHDVGLNNAKEVDESEKLRAELVAVEEVRWTLSTEFRFLPKVLVGTLFGDVWWIPWQEP